MILYRSYLKQSESTFNNDIKSDFERMHQDFDRIFANAKCCHNQLIQSGYEYAALFELLVKQTDVLALMQEVSFCVIVSVVPEFDPSFTHIGCYLKDRYQLLCDMIDISDQTSLPIFSAVSIMSDYMVSTKVSHTAILVFQQKGYLKSINCQKTFCFTNSVGAYFFRNSKRLVS